MQEKQATQVVPTPEITFEVVGNKGRIPALHKHNSLVHAPFAWRDASQERTSR